MNVSVSTPKRRRIRGKLSKHYFCQVYNRDTRKQRWVSTGCTSMDAAKKYRRQLEENAGELPREEAPPATVHAALAEWLEVKQSRMTPAGYAADRGRVDRWKEHFADTLPLADLSPALLDAYFVERRRDIVGQGKRKRPISATTLNKEITLWKAFAKWALGRALVTTDPTVTLRRYAQEKRAIRALSDEEAAKLLRVCSESYTTKHDAVRNGKRQKWEQTHEPPHWLRPLVELAIETGLRFGNLEQLTWRHVDLERAEIRFSAGETKARGELLVPLSDAALAVLRALKRDAKGVRVLPLPNKHNAMRSFRKAVARAGVAPLRFHDLRSTFVSAMRRAGVELEVTAELVGHRSVQTTLKHYRSVDAAELREAVKKKGRAANGR